MPVARIAASELPFDDLVDGLNRGYAGYNVPIQFDTERLLAHIAQNAIDLALSRVALLEDTQQIVAVGLLARRSLRAWIGGMGVDAAHRRNGLARSLLLDLLQAASEQRCQTVQLEVLEDNTPAHTLYDNLGFVTRRKLHILARDADRTPPATAAVGTISSVPAGDALMFYHDFHTVQNPWQREFESLQESPPGLSGWVLLADAQPLAYAVARVGAGLLSLVDVASAPGQTDALTALLAEIHRQHPDLRGQIVNVSADDPALLALQTVGYSVRFSQLEMLLAL